jgi:hypothetical protein
MLHARTGVQRFWLFLEESRYKAVGPGIMTPYHQCALLRLNGASGRLRVIVGAPSNHHAIFTLPQFADVNAALEEGAIANADALCGHIPGQRTFTADVHTVAGIDIAAHFAKNHHFPGSDIRRHLGIPANRDPAVRRVDRTLDVAFDIQRFGTYDFALDLQALADRGRISGCGRWWRGVGGAGSWITAMDTDDRVSSSVEDSEGVPGWLCSLLMVNTVFSILHRHNSVGPISCLLLANNATSARLGAQLRPGDASDSPQAENKIRNHYKEEQPDSHRGGTDVCANQRCGHS